MIHEQYSTNVILKTKEIYLYGPSKLSSLSDMSEFDVKWFLINRSSLKI